MKKASRLNPDRVWGDIAIIFLDDAGITHYNLLYLDHAGATDVISFATSPFVQTDVWQGEILVNAQRAAEYGSKLGNADFELALYLAHGINHLTGADDATAAERQRMRSRELRWLDEADEEGVELYGLLLVP